MAESSGFQGLDKFLKAQLKRGLELARELETQLNFAQGPDCTNLICNYLDNIVITFSSARGLISLNSRASNFEGTENPIENHFGGIEAGHSQKYVKDNRNSCARSPSRSPCPRSRSRSATGYNSPSNWSDLSVSRNRLGTGKQKCHEFAESWENEGFSNDREQAISRKRNRLGTGKQKCHEFDGLGTGKQKCHEFAESWEYEGFSKDREPAISRKRRCTPTSTTIVPANSSEPGNDIPSEDGYTWRKYGQKETLGDKHPRMYYRCTYRDDRGCKAKKIVQKPNDNSSVFQVKYSELHSCQRDAQFFKSPSTGSPIKTPIPICTFQAYDGGVTSDSFVSSPSNLPNDDSSAQREMPLTSHSAADQMPRWQSSEKEAYADWTLQDDEWLSQFVDKHFDFKSSDFAYEAYYMPPTNPPMQTRDTSELRSQASGSDIGSSNR